MNYDYEKEVKELKEKLEREEKQKGTMSDKETLAVEVGQSIAKAIDRKVMIADIVSVLTLSLHETFNLLLTARKARTVSDFDKLYAIITEELKGSVRLENVDKENEKK